MVFHFVRLAQDSEEFYKMENGKLQKQIDQLRQANEVNKVEFQRQQENIEHIRANNELKLR